MTRDSESLIEILICMLIATTLIACIGSERWLELDESAQLRDAHPQLLITAESIFLKGSMQHQTLRFKTSVNDRQVEKISGLLELNELLFAKPIQHRQNKTALQSC